MLDGSVEALEFTATASSRSVLDKPLKDLTLKKGVLLAAIARENKIIIPGGLTTIQEGDHVVVVTKSQVFDDLTDILLEGNKTSKQKPPPLSGGSPAWRCWTGPIVFGWS